jgi:hypothetical protein
VSSGQGKRVSLFARSACDRYRLIAQPALRLRNVGSLLTGSGCPGPEGISSFEGLCKRNAQAKPVRFRFLADGDVDAKTVLRTCISREVKED